MNAARSTMKQVLEDVIDEMVDKGIYWNEAQEQFEKLFIIKALDVNRGNLSKAARTMGVHRNTLTKKLRLHKLDKRDFRKG
ncbi:MAG TPA: helix-turn-helix domain-containing protein [Acidobacteriota bacterium]|nr:helix-turn-helix domain-containing protein [Acidobacteriota bacterium]